MDLKPAPGCPHLIRARCFADPSALARAVADLLAAQLAASSAEPQAVMLAGGTTPMAAYELLAQDPPVLAPSTHLLFSDDRHVRPDSPKSNYGNMLRMLRALRIPPERVFRVWGELGLADAAGRYNDELNQYLSRGGRVALGLLGLGADGHTASLFNRADVEAGAGAWAIPVKRPDGLNGVSVTSGFLRRVARVVFVVAGADKQVMAGRLLREPDSIAAGLAIKGHAAVELWTDTAAWPFEASAGPRPA